MFIARDAGDVYNILPTNFGQKRQKWISRRRNFKVDGIVLLKQSDVPRNQWSMGKITDVNNDQKGLV